MIHLSPDVARLARMEYPTTKWCGQCNTYFVLLPGKEGIHCRCRYIQVSNGRALMVDLAEMGE